MEIDCFVINLSIIQLPTEGGKLLNDGGVFIKDVGQVLERFSEKFEHRTSMRRIIFSDRDITRDCDY